MKNLREFGKRVSEIFGDALAVRGFSPTRMVWKFSREKQGVEQSIDFVGNWEYRTERFRFHFAVADRYLQLEQAICGDGSREGPLGPIVPYIASANHLLRGERGLREWYLDAPDVVHSFLGELDAYGIPFVNRYADLLAVKQHLESSSRIDPFILTNEGRLCLLAAIQFFEGRRKEALAIIDDALAERWDAMPKYRTQLEQLRARLVSNP